MLTERMDMLQAQQRAAELLEELRGKLSDQTPLRWSTAIDMVRGGGDQPALFEQDTILGDFLRELRQIGLDSEATIDLSSFVSQRRRSAPVASVLSVTKTGGRDHGVARGGKPGYRSVG